MDCKNKEGRPFNNGQPLFENPKASTKLIDYRMINASLAKCLRFRSKDKINLSRLSFAYINIPNGISHKTI